MTTVRVNCDGVTLTGTRVGERPEVVLLHAGGENRWVWAPVAARMARRGIASVAYDLRGHGDSGGTRRSDLAGFAADAGAIIDSLDTEPVVVGASLGGPAAVEVHVWGHLVARDRPIQLAEHIIRFLGRS